MPTAARGTGRSGAEANTGGRVRAYHLGRYSTPAMRPTVMACISASTAQAARSCRSNTAAAPTSAAAASATRTTSCTIGNPCRTGIEPL